MSVSKSNNFQKINGWITAHLTHIPFIQKIFFVEHLQTMVHAGLSLVESLEVLGKEIENKALQKIIIAIKEGVEKGQQLSDVLAEHPKAFPPIYVKMIAAGETAGKLEEALGQVTTQMQKTKELTSSVRGAMIYPCVILAAMIGIGIMMVTVILPKLLAVFAEFNATLPLATRILIAITNFLGKPINLILIIVLILGTITSFVVGLKQSLSFRRIIHRLNLHLPIIGAVIKKINLARFSLTLSSVMKSTVPIVEGVNIAGETCGNLLYKEALLEASERIKTGTPLSEILNDHHFLFPPMVTEMIMVGERTGEIDNLLTELSNFYGKEVDKTMKNFTTIIEPIIIVILGISVGGIAMAVIMPMYSLAQNF